VFNHNDEYIYKPLVNIHHEMATNIQTNDLSEFMACFRAFDVR